MATLKNNIRIFILFTLLSLFSASVFAQNTQFSFLGNGDFFTLDKKTDFILLGTGLSAAGTSFILEKTFSKNQPDFNLSTSNINDFDKIFMKPYSKNIDTIATITSCACLITPLVLLSTEKSEWFTAGTMFAESFILAYGLKGIAKTFVYRPRPYMYFENSPANKIEDGDWCKSFPSGHTTFAFTGAAFSSYVFCKYFPDSPWRFAVIAGTYALAATTGCLRIASGNHFMTDVITGAAIGTLCGIIVPWLHTRKTGNSKKNSDFFSSSYSPSDSSSFLNCIQISPYSVGFSFKL